MCARLENGRVNIRDIGVTLNRMTDNNIGFIAV